MHYQNILFDLDCTLTAPREGITRSLQHALARLGIDEPERQALEHFIGPPLLWFFMHSYGFGSSAELQTEALTYHFASLAELHRAFGARPIGFAGFSRSSGR